MILRIEISYDVLSYFPTLYDNYEKITATPGSSHVQICNYVKRHFDRGNDDTNFFSTCQKIAIFIKYLQDNDHSSDIDRTCKYLNYLINSQVRKFNYPPYETKEFYVKIIQEYEKKKYPLNTICKGVIEHLDNNIFEKIQKLYNLYYRFNKFINMSSSSRECKILDEYVQLYRVYMEGCGEESESLFCKALKNFSHYCYNYNYILMGCPEVWSSLHSHTLKDYSDADAVENDSGYNGSSNGVTISISLVGTFCAIFLLYKVNKFYILKYEYYILLFQHDYYRNFFLITIAMFINIYFSFHKYQFTPIRSMIDPQIRKTKKTLKDPVQISNELQPHEHNDYLKNVDINRYNVGYQST
ncbi:hypothetical protein PVNG_05432 [Plasmodium vivax North Korean]|uniref:Variable surface protein n=1 Tax=Plasmodium vivax North Korean TaxID=1035514 RepID=A0A0J9TNY3_PLAVI|nr:hypothetical protein PVNG_05432 [Plasmodium vivax North Korean]